MAELTARTRTALPSSSFAGPDRSYPIHDESHARNALSRVAQFGSPALQARVRGAVHRRYPNIGKGSGTLTMLGQRTLAGYQKKYGTEAGHAKFDDAIARGILDRSRMETTGNPAQGAEVTRKQLKGSAQAATQRGGPYVAGFNEQPTSRGAMGTGKPEGIGRPYQRNPQEDMGDDETEGGPPSSQDREPKPPMRRRRGAQGSYQR